ncbi:MAG: putative toxin-antitoxin system toxin component, PIN family, partial [Chloroflexota bacterium]
STGPLGMRIRDPNDAHVLAAALAGNVDYLVTGDADLLVLDGTLPAGAPRIFTPAWFVREVLGD